MKYVIKNCNCYQLGACCATNTDRLYCKDVTDCLLKRIVEKTKEVVQANHCNNCDGIGYDSNCQDSDCGTYQCTQILEMLEIEEYEE